jgi:hypothetical protein
MEYLGRGLWWNDSDDAAFQAHLSKGTFYGYVTPLVSRVLQYENASS